MREREESSRTESRALRRCFEGIFLGFRAAEAEKTEAAEMEAMRRRMGERVERRGRRERRRMGREERAGICRGAGISRAWV